MLNGVFGSGKDLHVAAWQAVKVADRSEEVEENGTIVQRERERFTNELTLVFASGETAILRYDVRTPSSIPVRPPPYRVIASAELRREP